MTSFPLCPPDEIPVGEKRRFVVQQHAICVVHCSGGFFAVDDQCAHAHASLAGGRVVNDQEIECPRHGSRFDVQTGAPRTLPATHPLRTYPIQILNGILTLTLP